MLHKGIFSFRSFCSILNVSVAGDKLFQYITCPAGRVTYNFIGPANTCTFPLKVCAIMNVRE